MRENFLACLKEVLRHEGGYVNHPQDAGGATNFGVTQATYDGYRRRRNLLPRSVKLITADEVADCYRSQYWDKVCGDQLPKGIDFCVFDAAVNSGAPRAEKWLQQAINTVAGTARLKVDGAIGEATLDASDDYPAGAIINAYIDARLGFMKVAKNTKTGALLWPIFGTGWSNRLLGELPKGAKTRRPNGVLQVATAMAGAGVVAPESAVAAKPALPPEALTRAAAPAGAAGWITAGLLVAGALAAGGINGVFQWLG